MRRALNAIGRTLIVGGTLLLLFVAYQLWGTGLYTDAQQSALRGDLRTTIREASRARAPVSGTTTTTRPAPPPPEGDAVGFIKIPKIGVDDVVVQGISVPDLRKGPGHYPDSPMPGQLGNAAIAGHRTTYGAPFNRLDELAPNDPITIITPAGTFRYLVTEQLIVTKTQVEVLDPTPDATLTLTTCHPKYSARQRLIIKARLDLTESPKPVKPHPSTSKSSSKSPGRPAVDDLSGSSESRLPVIWSGLIAAAVGLAWWAGFRRRKAWFVWVAGAIPFLVAYALFCFYLERVLPPGF
ncbi:MAG: class E sortase [Acidimicrobiia bacterium]|nr:class E sortase [Acidimicrobiia bacterium]